jgi:hypothetical protein
MDLGHEQLWTTSGVAKSQDPMPLQRLTTAQSSTYLLDGSYETVAFTAPVNYRDANGSWNAIDNTLVPSMGDEYAVENSANDFRALMPADASDAPIHFSTEAGWVEFKMIGTDGQPTVTGSEASYTNVANADSVTYEATGAGLKETITLVQPPTEAAAYIFRLDMSAGLTPVLDASTGDLHFVDAQGGKQFVMPRGFMTDSSSPEPAFSSAVPYSLIEVADGWQLSMTPSHAWLSDPARVYPVEIDPTLTDATPVRDCWMHSNQPNTSLCGAPRIWAGVGHSGGKRRSLLAFDVSSIPRTAVVTDASVSLYLEAAETINVAAANYALRHPGSRFTDAATWNSPNGTASWDGGSPEYDAFSSLALNGSTSGYKSWDATDIVSGWVGNLLVNRGVLIKQGETISSALAFHSSNSAYVEKWPKLTVNYINEPVDDPESDATWDYLAQHPMDESDSLSSAETEGLRLRGGGTFSMSPDQGSSADFSSAVADVDGSSLPSAGWRACGIWDSRYQLVKSYYRYNVHPRMNALAANLRCGMKDNDPPESAFGFKHILDRHSDEWAALAARIGRNWRDLAGWTLDGTLARPSKVQNQSSIRFCYSKRFFYKIDGEVVDSWYARVYLGETAVRVMTLFPSRNPCRGDNEGYSECLLGMAPSIAREVSVRPFR